MIRLIIKGTPQDARAAAEERKVPIQDVKEGTFGFETFATTDDANRVSVIKWFCEEAIVKDQGFPVGTLLHHD
jgi:hypothetical protein